MIRERFIFVMCLLLFFYMTWYFYSEAINYNPLSAYEIKKSGKEMKSIIVSKYTRAWDKSIHEKNLFSPDRRYQHPKPALVITAPPEPPPVKPITELKGIIIDGSGDYVAYIQINQSKPVPMRKGDIVEDIELIDISDRKVVLKWMNEKIDLSLDRIKAISKPRT